MGSLFNYEPSGWREWHVNTGRYRFGNANRAEVYTSQSLQDVVAVTVLEFQCPYTWYTINSNNNVIAVLKVVAGVPSGYTVTLPHGNYTTDTLTAALTSTTAAVWPSGVAAAGPLFSAATYTTLTGKLTLTVNATVVTGGGWYFYTNTSGSIAAAALANSLVAPTALCIEPIGIADIRAPADLATTPGTPQELPYAIALGGPPYLALRANFGLGGGDNIVVCEERSGDQKFSGNILALIPINSVPGGTIQWTNPAPRGGMFSMDASQIDSATFWLTTGDDDTQLDLQGHGFQFKLGFIVRNRGSLMGGASPWTGDRVTSSILY